MLSIAIIQVDMPVVIEHQVGHNLSQFLNGLVELNDASLMYRSVAMEANALLQEVVRVFGEELMLEQVLLPVVSVREPYRVSPRSTAFCWFVHVEQLELLFSIHSDLEPTFNQLNAGHECVDVMTHDSDVMCSVVIDFYHHCLDSDESGPKCHVNF